MILQRIDDALDSYLRAAMAATLARGPARFDLILQWETHPARMPIEHASVIWPERLSPSVHVATLELPRQIFDNPAQLAFADVLSINPWHALPAHRPLGGQNRARRQIDEALSRLRQTMNNTAPIEPTGEECF